MEAGGSHRSWTARATSRAVAMLSLADDPADDDDLRRRKRVGVSAGYLTIVAPLALPLQAGGSA